MKLVVLGATGGIGLEIVGQAIERGHQVTAFVRAPELLNRFGNRIAVTRGDLLTSNDLQQVIQGSDAVVSGFGPRVPIAKSDHDLLQRFAVALTSAMQDAKVRRVVVVSTSFLFKDAVIPPAFLFGRLFFSELVADATEMEKIFRQSGLDWTIVRPPKLTDRPRSGKYRVRDGHLPSFGFSVSRADVADLMITTLEDRGSIGKIIGVAK